MLHKVISRIWLSWSFFTSVCLPTKKSFAHLWDQRSNH